MTTMYAWLDLETTGLNPESERILEVALRFTHENGSREGLQLYDYHRVLPLAPSTHLDDFVRSMHTRSGLLEECVAEYNRQIGTSWVPDSALLFPIISKAQEVRATFELKASNDLIFAGNSVHFDVAFLREHAPAVLGSFGHRLLDMSAVSIFCQSIGLPRPQKKEAHRATADVEESIGYFHHYRDMLQGALQTTYPEGLDE